MIRTAFAPAKVNLFLHVGPPAADGYHPLSSLVVFADAGDRLSVEPAERSAFVVEGPFAADLSAETDNLVLRAARALAERAGVALPPLRLVLTKALPVAAGLGGGSADAGAALRLLRDAFAPDLDDAALEAAAEAVGADGPMCVRARPVLAQGRGERLSPAPALPDLHAVLVNPRAPSPTGAVYRAYDEAPDPRGEACPALPAAFADVSALVAFLEETRNDLEPPAVRLTPVIGEVLARLRASPRTRLARLSGSGATAFALCADAEAARGLAREIAAARPGWWTVPCRLGAPDLG